MRAGALWLARLCGLAALVAAVLATLSARAHDWPLYWANCAMFVVNAACMWANYRAAKRFED